MKVMLIIFTLVSFAFFLTWAIADVLYVAREIRKRDQESGDS